MSAVGGNIFADLKGTLADEEFAEVLSAPNIRIERIVSTGHASPAGLWRDQAWAEWVIVLQGSAGLRFDGEDKVRVLGVGDYLHIPAHTRHRVEWTDPEKMTVWLAVHYT